VAVGDALDSELPADPSGRGCPTWYNRGAVKNKIHPKWYPEAKVSCACGSTFTTGSTLPTISVEICSACHPLFTGQQKFIDTAGRVDKFNQRVALADKKKAEASRIPARFFIPRFTRDGVNDTPQHLEGPHAVH
jgi:large subunit ribosomal protein L31